MRRQLFSSAEKGDYDEDDHDCREGGQTDPIIAEAHGNAEASHDPEGGGGGESAYFIVSVVAEDTSRADEADAADHLGDDAGGIDVGILGKHLQLNEGDHRRADADHGVGLDAGGMTAELSLDADRHTDHRCQQNTKCDFIPEHIKNSFEEIRVSAVEDHSISR